MQTRKAISLLWTLALGQSLVMWVSPASASSVVPTRIYWMEESPEVMQAYRQLVPRPPENVAFSAERAELILGRANAVWAACGISFDLEEVRKVPAQEFERWIVPEATILSVERLIRALTRAESSPKTQEIIRAVAEITAAGRHIAQSFFQTTPENLDDGTLRIIVLPSARLLFSQNVSQNSNPSFFAASFVTADLVWGLFSDFLKRMIAGDRVNFDRDNQILHSSLLFYGYHEDPHFDDAPLPGTRPGSDDFSVLAHEIGHVLGLMHTYHINEPGLMGWPMVNRLTDAQCAQAREFLVRKQARLTHDEVVSEFHRTAEKLAPLALLHGGELKVVSRDREDLHVTADRVGKEWQVIYQGDLAGMGIADRDVAAAVVCHELGHLMGGFPFAFPGDPQLGWLASEGQADYFSTHACLPYLWADELRENARFRERVTQEERQACDQIHAGQARRDLCYRTMNSAREFARVFVEFGAWPTPAFETPSSYVVRETIHWYGTPQCRIDTLAQGALCSTDFNFAVIPGLRFSGSEIQEAEREALEQSCPNRPRCWFRPLTY
jgi:hypothetical protein